MHRRKEIFFIALSLMVGASVLSLNPRGVKARDQAWKLAERWSQVATGRRGAPSLKLSATSPVWRRGSRGPSALAPAMNTTTTPNGVGFSDSPAAGPDLIALSGRAAPTVITATPVDFTVAEGTAFNGAVATFEDDNPAATPADFNASIDWGDGTATTAGTIGQSSAAFVVMGQHTYADEGAFTVTVTINDNPPGTGTATATDTATVTEADALSGTPVVFSAVSGQSFTTTVATFSDQLTTQVAGDFTATIDWGDATTTAGTVSGGGGSFQVSGTHTYAGPGTFSVVVTLSDDAPGTATAQVTSTANVSSTPQATISKAFNPATIQSGGTSTVTLTLTNPNNTSRTNASFTDMLVNMSAKGGTVGGTCTGTTPSSLSAGATNLSFSGITIPANSSCTVTFDVTSSTPGTQPNQTSGVTTTQTPTAGSPSNTANLTVVAPPTLTKSFNPTAINAGGVSQLSLTFTNPAGNPALTNLAVNDPLPSGVTVAASPGLVNTCNGTVTGATTGSNSISLSGGSLPAGASSCQVQVNVTSSTPGQANNTTGNVTATGSGVNVTGTQASASLTVVAPPTLTKSFNPTAISAGGVSQLSLTFTNPAGNPALTNLAVNDPLPSGVTVAASPGLTNTCGGTVTGATAGSTAISLSGGTLPAGSSSCQLQVNVTSSTAGQANNTTGAVTATGSGVNVTGNTATASLLVVPFTVKITEPPVCTGPGSIVGVTATLTNSTSVAQSVSFTASLPPQLLALSGTCTASTGTCQVASASSVTAMATLAPGQTLTLTYQAEVADGTPPGTQLCITSMAAFGGGSSITVQACTTVNCPTGGMPGLPLPAASALSDQKAGSVLVYNFYTSSASNPGAENTRINLTNANPAQPASLHLFFVDGSNCGVADFSLCLTPNQTMSFLASDLDPGVSGYLIVVAVDRVTGCPANFNFLIGDEYVKLASGHAANLGAEAFAALAGGIPVCDANAVTATLKFDGVSYNQAGRVLAVSNIASPADGNATLLVINRLGGDLINGASRLGTLFGILYDDLEKGLSFSLSGGCQLRGVLSNGFPRTTPRFGEVISSGRSGWLKLWAAEDAGILGAVINSNPRTASNPGAFGQGHNLHKLTLTSAASLTIPVFAPSCR